MDGLLVRMALAFGIGLLVGLERGWSTRQLEAGRRAAGVRTFAITGLLGGLIGALARSDAGGLELPGALIVSTAFAVFSTLILVFSREENRASGKQSATTAVAAVLTFTLSVYSMLGDVHVATATAVIATGVLALREGIHRWIEKITQEELQSGLLLLAMSFVALPVVPERAIGPFGGVEVREVWIIAIILASVSFVAYVAVKYFGARKGALISGALGGLVSSTAVAFMNARRAADRDGSPHILAAATAVATAISFIRVTALVGVLAPSVVFQVGLPLAAAALVAGALAAGIVYRAAPGDRQQGSTPFRNPFNFWSVLLIAISMGALILVGRYINARFGASATILGAASMGLFDVDAMTIAMARLVPDSLSPLGGAQAILAGVASNTVVKVVIAGFIGRGRFALDVTLAASGCLATGALVMLGMQSMG